METPGRNSLHSREMSVEVVRNCKEARALESTMGRVVGNVNNYQGLGPVWSPPSEDRKLNLKETLGLSPGGGYKQRFHRALTNKPRAPSGPGGREQAEKHRGEKQPCLFRKPDAVCFSRLWKLVREKPDAVRESHGQSLKGLVFWVFSVVSVEPLGQRVSSKVKLELIWLQSNSRAKGPITVNNPVLCFGYILFHYHRYFISSTVPNPLQELLSGPHFSVTKMVI